MEHILFFNTSYPLEPLCRALRAGGAVSTVTESFAEWQHLSRIRPWSLCVLAVEAANELPEMGSLPECTALLMLGQDELPQRLSRMFSVVWRGGASASAVLRAAHHRGLVVAEAPGELVIGSLILCASEHSLWWEGQEILLTPRQFSIIRLLASQPGRIFSRVEIWEHCWGLSDYPESNAVDAHIRRIRNRIPSSFARAIETSYGVGYRFLPNAGRELGQQDPVLMNDGPKALSQALATV